MKKSWLFLVILLLTYGSVFASPFPDPSILNADPELLPPPIEGDFPVQPSLEPPSTPEVFEFSTDAIQHASGPLYATMMGLTPTKSTLPEEPYIGSDDFTIASTVIGSVNMTNDSYQDTEPAVVALTIGDTDYITTAYIKFPSDRFRIYTATTNDYFNTIHHRLIYVPYPYTRSADPMIDANIYSSGITPKRTYLTGLLMNEGATNTAIGVWRSDNGGLSWTGPVIVATSTEYSRPVDKPDIVVSWYSGTRGYVYVAYVKIAPDGNTQYLYIVRSTNGGQTFDAPVLVTATNNSINGPQVLVNPYYGNVYVLWTDFVDNAIKMSTSYDYGLTWTYPETLANATVKMLGGRESDYIYGGARGIRAGSLPMARFNWVANRICVVWHEKESSSTIPPKTDVYYTSKSPSGRQPKVRVNDVTRGDQFMPALDFDSTGNMIVTFYDRRDDPGNLFYHEYMARISPTGTLLEPNVRVSTFQSDPRAYSYYPEYIFLGDYQDIWDWTFIPGEYYISSWVGIPAMGDIYLSVIQP